MDETYLNLYLPSVIKFSFLEVLGTSGVSRSTISNMLQKIYRPVLPYAETEDHSVGY